MSLTAIQESMSLGDTRVYEPQIRARLGTAPHIGMRRSESMPSRHGRRRNLRVPRHPQRRVSCTRVI